MSTSRRRGVFSLGRYRLPVVGSSTRLSQLVQPTSSSAHQFNQQHQQQQLLESGSSGSSSKVVKYTPCGRPDLQLDDELEEIAVVSVSGVESGQLTYGTGTSMVNGPRVVPGNTIPLYFLKTYIRSHYPYHISLVFIITNPTYLSAHKRSIWIIRFRKSKTKSFHRQQFPVMALMLCRTNSIFQLPSDTYLLRKGKTVPWVQ